MKIPNDLISQFVKITKDTKKSKNETTVYGTISIANGKKYVKIDGSNLLTPVSSTTDSINGERVTVMIKNHTAIVTGNISSPAARVDDVSNIASSVGDKVDNEEFISEKQKVETLSQNSVLMAEDLVTLGNTVTGINETVKTLGNSLTSVTEHVATLETKTILYDAVPGVETAITLSDICANYKALEIYFGDEINSAGGFIKIDTPEGKKATLSIDQISSTSARYSTMATYTISGSAITPDVATACRVIFAGTSSITTTVSYGTNYIRITKIIGLK